MTLASTILIVDPDQDSRISLYEGIGGEGGDAVVAENGRMALDLLQRQRFGLVVVDTTLIEQDEFKLLKDFQENDHNVPVIVLTRRPRVETAKNVIRFGAYDYLVRPVAPDELVRMAQTRAGDMNSTRSLPGETLTDKPLRSQRQVVGNDLVFQRLLQRAESVASSKASILILGESGTGKEVIARHVHEVSNRANGPFVALNCAALPEGLLESELFGHEKGAFTGAVTAKKGKFELADGGTLLLDEISEIPIHLQAKLLRVLQEEEVDRLGGRAPVKIDVHIIATSNLDLHQAVAEGNFREDLYYRLNVIPIMLPPLRKRPNDVLLLAEHFVKSFSRQYEKDVKKMSSASCSRFMRYPWPGNVREMENLVERAVLLAGSDYLEPWDFWDEEPADSGQDGEEEAGASPDQDLTSSRTAIVVEEGGEMVSLKNIERQMIMQALQKTDNNRTRAASILGISVRTLRNKLNDYRRKGLVA